MNPSRFSIVIIDAIVYNRSMTTREPRTKGETMGRIYGGQGGNMAYAVHRLKRTKGETMDYWIQELSQTADPTSDFRWRAAGAYHGPYDTALAAIETKDDLGGTFRVVDDDANVIEYGSRFIYQSGEQHHAS